MGRTPPLPSPPQELTRAHTGSIGGLPCSLSGACLSLIDYTVSLSFYPLCQETMACLGAMATAVVVTRHCPLLLCNGLPLPLCCTCTHTSTLYIFPVRVAPNTASAAQCVWRQAYHALLSGAGGAGGGSISSSPSDSETFSSHMKLVLLCTSSRI